MAQSFNEGEEYVTDSSLLEQMFPKAFAHPETRIIYDNTQELGKSLQIVRKQLKLRANVVAGRAGIKPSYLSMIENGKKTPTIDVLSKIAVALCNTPLAYIFLQAEFLSQRDNPDKQQLIENLAPIAESMMKTLFWDKNSESINRLSLLDSISLN